ncbi:hypothetical protein HJA76_26015 [Rhizobium bangladeshense]|nr:hypothetical protein [Rhizobium bangladeshense]MBX4923080.1 hypothetical protein [Rhizobium bangladeshense]
MVRFQNVAADDAEKPEAGEQMWSVFEFARRYRLAKREENRLLMLYGPPASLRDLLAKRDAVR